MTQSVLYRLFGDKAGLLDALADHGLERDAAIKAAHRETSDPVSDLRCRWDDHMLFAQESTALYQLMFAPRAPSLSAARGRIFDQLVATLTRCAATGSLTIKPVFAARLILSANVGVALNQIAEPTLFGDATLSHRMRDSVFRGILSEPDEPAVAPSIEAAALRLRSQLVLSGTDALDDAEAVLHDRWLSRSGHRAEGS